MNRLELWGPEDWTLDGVMLRTEGAYIVVSVETQDTWVDVIREPLGTHIHHIVEPAGIKRRVLQQLGYGPPDERAKA